MNDQPVFRKELEEYMDAALPILYVDTLENGKVQDILADVAKKKGRSVVSWSMHSGYVEEGGGYPTDLCGALASVLREQNFTRKILVLEDVAGELESPAIVSRLRCIAERIVRSELEDCTVVLIAPLISIPRALEPYITLMNLDYLSQEKIKEHILDFVQNNYIQAPNEELLEQFAMHLRGLTETELDNILALTTSDDRELNQKDLRTILRQKQQIIKKSGILEMVTVKETVEDIGGLQNLKDWLRTKAQIFRDVRRAKAFGVDIPKGVLIAGMPGCGKSLTAKAAASMFKVPLLRMDMGRLMGKYVGESEANMRRALQLTEASSPCVLWIDELEKAFAGAGAQGGSSEVTTRLFGSFLTWMQEKDSLAFVVATANNISHLPPELMRKGRFDEIFYVDFPNQSEREKIISLHIGKRRSADLAKIDVAALARKMKGYCGADIESVVRDGVEAAFVAGKAHVTTEDLQAAIGRTHPISETMKDAIEEMDKTYKSKKFTNASREE
ncbi:AAA family ATPase [uncultured Selenomonas sp.]|uniref:AAA family ATPase n=1 Tax=uncultured Selenomonas sp. TaxID=159275 RepID=UPI0028DD323C|nr:AAA family ATPase [uncultured Selenomonas sp.]